MAPAVSSADLEHVLDPVGYSAWSARDGRQDSGNTLSGSPGGPSETVPYNGCRAGLLGVGTGPALSLCPVTWDCRLLCPMKGSEDSMSDREGEAVKYPGSSAPVGWAALAITVNEDNRLWLHACVVGFHSHRS